MEEGGEIKSCRESLGTYERDLSSYTYHVAECPATRHAGWVFVFVTSLYVRGSSHTAGKAATFQRPCLLSQPKHLGRSDAHNDVR